jgi:hypothetical protein
MAFNTEDAAQRYANGIDPYMDVYRDTKGMNNSQDVQDEFISKAQETSTLEKRDLVERFAEGYASDGNGGSGSISVDL